MDAARSIRTPLFAALALVGFAANSLLCRIALGTSAIDAASFTTVRLGAGAVVLVGLSWLSRGRGAVRGGSLPSGLSLFLYAAAFSIAYRRLPTGTGALILFGAVQATMIGWGLRRGERLGPAEWIGLALALGGLIGLTRPGSTAPDPLGAVLMCCAGIAWGIYSLRGRGGGDPLVATAANFARAVLPSLLWSLAAARHLHVTPRGVALAAASGALASGLGYSLWYAALRQIPMTRAAVIQLAVPVLAASGGVALLGERITLRLVLAGAAILGGVALAIAGRRG